VRRATTKVAEIRFVLFGAQAYAAFENAYRNSSDTDRPSGGRS
jgi:hypothetical protein